MVMLRRWPVLRRENGCYRGGLFNLEQNGHAREVAS